MNSFDYPERLVQGVKSGSVIPFVGAGASKKSMPNHFPTWRELASLMNDRAMKISAISSQEYTEIKQLIKANRLTFVMDALKKSLPREEYESLLAEKFEYVDTTGADLTTQNLILRIAGKLIITTNYDRLLEDAFAKKFRRSPTTATFEQSSSVQYSIQDHRNSGDPTIFKIHGDIKAKNSVILSERDYRSLLYDQQAYEAVVTSLFISNVFLFIGFSLEDREVLFHLERLRHQFSYVTQSHYAVMPSGKHSNLESRQFRELYGVEIITFDPANGYAQIDKFLEGLIRKAGKK